MKTRRLNLSEDGLIMTQNITRSNKSEEPVPTDLIFEILSRLPAKSIARCRCVSKLWKSMILHQYFTELFLTRSCTNPQILFSCQNFNNNLVFFSTPQNPDVNLSHAVAANYHMKFSFDDTFRVCVPVHGLLCIIITKRVEKGKKETVPVICNPSTGESLTLPKVKTRRVGVRSLLGYEPVDKKFKVLSMTSTGFTAGYTGDRMLFQEHQILTLGTGNLSWRKIKCCVSHAPSHYYPEQEICINGVLYYPARNWNLDEMIACFDIRSEKFSLIKYMKNSTVEVGCGTLTNYNGKLGLLFSEGCGSVCERSRTLELYVLEDFEKHEWSMLIHILPAFWKNVVDRTHLWFVGVTHTNEIVLRTADRTLPFCLFYYNIERNTFTRVNIQRLEDENKIFTFLDHVEDVTLMQVLN